ncbi:MAG: pantetheine-phosphate adenylyltransferase [Candidatus Omnitrophica bacterium]|nr:pantetheine-phosphate adenylyltransferase [Candidatus Omnitrophota bacterium]
MGIQASPVTRHRAVYPGTFDPVTYGHIDLIKRARLIFDELIVAVAHNPSKAPLFSVEERKGFLRRAVQGLDGVSVIDFEGLAVKFVRSQESRVMIRGMRMISDFELEYQMATTNRKLDDGVETLFLMPSETNAHLSSRLLKEAAALGAELAAFVPGYVEEALKKKLNR